MKIRSHFEIIEEITRIMEDEPGGIAYEPSDEFPEESAPRVRARIWVLLQLLQK